MLTSIKLFWPLHVSALLLVQFKYFYEKAEWKGDISICF